MIERERNRKPPITFFFHLDLPLDDAVRSMLMKSAVATLNNTKKKTKNMNENENQTQIVN